MAKKLLKTKPKKALLIKTKNEFLKKRVPVDLHEQPKESSLLVITAKKIKDFLDLAPKKKIAIISDNDADGITSAVQLKFYLDSKKVESKIFFYDHYIKQLSYPKQTFIEFNPEKTFFLDLSDGFVSQIVADLGNSIGPFISIDHHQREVVNGNAFKSIVIKPSSFSEVEPSKYPVSKMVFDLFGGRDWICAIGLIGDVSDKNWPDFMNKVKTKYKLTQKKVTELEEIVTCISSQYTEKINSLSDFLIEAKGPSSLFKSDYVGLKKLFDARIKILKEVFKTEAECFDDVNICFFKCDNRFSSKMSTVLSMEHPNKVLIVYEKPGDSIKCSIRRQDYRVNCGELAKFAILGIPDSRGGGHIPAAGAQFPPEYLEQFKKQARMYLLTNPPKDLAKS